MAPNSQPPQVARSAAPAPIDFVRGDATGLSIPGHGNALREAGEAWLTHAFQSFGALAPTNRVERIVRWEHCPGGSTGQKFFLSVDYAHPQPGLHRDLFVKFSRDFKDPVRDDRGKHEMESEVRFAAISRLPSFPINVPVAYFADFHHDSKTGLLITQQIAFGTGGIEPHHEKCMDHELEDPLAHYQTLIRALARIIAAHRSGRLSPDIAAQFPYDPELAAAHNPICYDLTQMQELVRQYADYAARCPQLLPARVRTPEFIDALARDTRRYLEHQTTIKHYLQSDPNLIALCHWNAQIDNGWFWRDASGALQCGLMDWGHVNQMNVAFSLWGCLSGAEWRIWESHLDELLMLFTAEIVMHGGPRIDIGELKFHLQLYIAVMGLSYFLASPSRILARMPDAADASGPRDPMILRAETVRNNVQILSTFMNLWKTHDFGAVLDRLLERTGTQPGR